MTSGVHLSPSAIEDLLNSSQGFVARDLLRRGTLVESQAKINATGRQYQSGLRGPRVRTGRLRASITHALGHDERGLYVDVGTNVVYGRYLELGETRNGKKFPFLLPALEAGQ